MVGNFPPDLNVRYNQFDTTSGSNASVSGAMEEARKMNNKSQVALFQNQAEQQRNQALLAVASSKVDVSNKVGQISGKVQL